MFPFLSVLTQFPAQSILTAELGRLGIRCECVDGGFYTFMLTYPWKSLGKELQEVTVVAGNRNDPRGSLCSDILL